MDSVRRASTSLASTVLHSQKSHLSSAAALATKPPETYARYSRPVPQRPNPVDRPQGATIRRPGHLKQHPALGPLNLYPSRDPGPSNASRNGNRVPSSSFKPTGYTFTQRQESRHPLNPRVRSPGESSKPVAVVIPSSGKWSEAIPVDTVIDAENNEAGRRRRHGDSKGDKRRSLLFGSASTTAPTAPAPPIPRRRVRSKGKVAEIKVERDVFIPSAITVENLARVLNVKRERVQDVIDELGLGSSSYDTVLKSDDASLIAIELGCNPVVDDAAAFNIYPEPLPSDLSHLPVRPPIVTIMGHVDHGKTTLLDTLRSASVAQGESGGITQHIGAFSVPLSSMSCEASGAATKSVTFLDTPGHAAFSAMRARGANVTDIIVLVVAADDGVMPQTREVIELARKEGNTPLIVAINKCDKQGVDTTIVKNALLGEGVILEEFDGDVPCVEVSGLTGAGLANLMEAIIAVAEVSDIRAESDLRAHGHVLEARKDKGKGPIATVLVSRGTLRRGDSILAGETWAKVRQMTDDKGKVIDVAPPGTPVIVSGWKDLPAAGDEVLAASGKRAADDVKRAVENRVRAKESLSLVGDVQSINEKRQLDRDRREQVLAAVAKETDPRKARNLEAPPSAYETSVSELKTGMKELRIVVKADVSGTAEAVVEAISGIGNKDVKVSIIQSSVGEVTDSDVDLAAATEAMILCFNIETSRAIETLASRKEVPVHSDTVIYRLIEEVTKRLTSLLPKIIETKVLGEATVQQVFQVKEGKTFKPVAGCRVTNGLLEKHKSGRVIRGGKTIATGTFDEMRRMKTDIKDARKGMECGLTLIGFTDWIPGDRLQMFETVHIEPSL